MPPPLRTSGGGPGPSTGPPANPLRTFGFLLLGIGLLSGFGLGIGRVVRVLNWHSWSHTQARYLDARAVSSGRGGGGGSCSRAYEVQIPGGAATVTTDAPCMVLIGSNPEPGSMVDVAFEPPSKVLSETEVYALGVFELVAPLVLVSGVGLLIASRRRA